MTILITKIDPTLLHTVVPYDTPVLLVLMHGGVSPFTTNNQFSHTLTFRRLLTMTTSPPASSPNLYLSTFLSLSGYCLFKPRTITPYPVLSTVMLSVTISLVRRSNSNIYIHIVEHRSSLLTLPVLVLTSHHCNFFIIIIIIITIVQQQRRELLCLPPSVISIPRLRQEAIIQYSPPVNKTNKRPVHHLYCNCNYLLPLIFYVSFDASQLVHSHRPVCFFSTQTPTSLLSVLLLTQFSILQFSPDTKTLPMCQNLHRNHPLCTPISLSPMPHHTVHVHANTGLYPIVQLFTFALISSSASSTSIIPPLHLRANVR